MKKSILALTLVAALSMLGACSSDNNDTSTGVSGNFALEPISDAKLEIWKLAEFNVTGKDYKAVDTATTSIDGSFNFPSATAGEAYVVSIAKDGLVGAKLMDKAGGTPWSEVTPPAITETSAIIVPANTNALLNPIGLAATVATGISMTQPLSADNIKNAGTLVNNSINTIVTHLSALTQAAGFYVDADTLKRGAWSPKLEVAIQLAERTTGASMSDLASDNFELTTEIKNLAIAALPAAKAAAEAAKEATGSTEEVKPDTIDTNKIVATYLFNANATNPTLLPAQLNASNGTYVVDGKAFGANASLSLEITEGTLKLETQAGQAKLIPAKSIDATTVTESSKGITAQDGKKGSAFAYDVVKAKNGTYTATVRASYDNSPNTENKIIFNVNSSLESVNATFFTTK